MADGAMALHPVLHRLLGEGVANKPDMALHMELRAVEGDDACCLLAAMLERVQAKRHDRRCILPPEDAEHAAFIAKGVGFAVVEMVVHGRNILRQPCQALGWIGLGLGPQIASPGGHSRRAMVISSSSAFLPPAPLLPLHPVSSA